MSILKAVTVWKLQCFQRRLQLKEGFSVVHSSDGPASSQEQRLGDSESASPGPMPHQQQQQQAASPDAGLLAATPSEVDLLVRKVAAIATAAGVRCVC